MTINLADNTPRVSYNVAEGVTQTSFVVSFEFFADADLNLYVDNVLKTLTTDYTVSGGSGSTGTATISVTGATGGSVVTITRDIALERTTDFPSQGAFQIDSLNTELDKITAQFADRKDDVDRAMILADSDSAVSMTIPLKADRLGSVLAFNATTGAPEAGPTIGDVSTVAAITADIATLADIEDGTDATDAIQTVAGISANVSTVAGVSSNVTTVAGISADVTSVAGDATDIGKVAAIDSDVTSVAAVDSDVTTVAGISANVTTVAGDSGDITALAAKTTEISLLGTADAIADMNTLGTSAIVTDMDALADISSDITTVADIDSDVTTVAGQTTNMQNITDNLSDIQNAATNAATATTKATEAATSATNAATSESNAASSATASASSATSSAASESAASTSESNASTSESNASTSASSASTSATTATTQAGIATTKAGEASTSASNAATSETNAATSESNASTSASNAATSATSAANSAASAAASFDSFDDRYLGTKSSDPTVDNDGNALVEGALYFSSTDNEMKVYDGANWIAASSAGSASLILYEYTATSSQTTFSGSDDNSATLSYTANNIQVVMNGVILDPSDYTATNGTSVVLTSGAATGDLLNIYAFKSFTVADTVSASAGGTFAADVTVTGTVAATAYTGDGSALTGISSVGGATGVSFNDSVKAQFGTGNDLLIYHDGTDSYVYDDGTGNLKLRTGGTAIELLDSVGNSMAKFTSGGDTRLYRDGSEKLRTTSTGVYVNDRLGVGTASPSTAIHASKTSTASQRIRLENSEGSADYGTDANRAIIWVGGNQKLRLDSGGELRLNAEGGSVASVDVRQGSSKAWFRVHYSGGVPTQRDALNVASYTDTATGRTTVNYTNAMNNSSYVVNGTNHSNNSVTILIGSITTTKHLFNNYDGGYTDTEFGGAIHGDLA